MTLRTRLVHQVERRLGDSAETRETARRSDVFDAGFAGLGAKRQPDILGKRVRCAEECRECVVRSADRVEVLLDAVPRYRFDDQPGAVGSQRLAHVACGADRVSHVVQAVEHRDEVVAAPWKRGSRANFEPGPILQSAILRLLASKLD